MEGLKGQMDGLKKMEMKIGEDFAHGVVNINQL